MHEIESFFVYVKSGQTSYYFSCDHVKEILPYPIVKKIDSLPSFILGEFTYQSAILPLIDFSYFSFSKSPPSLVLILQMKEALFGLAVPATLEISSERKEAVFLDFSSLLEQLPFKNQVIKVPLPSVPYLSLTLVKEGQHLIALRSEMIEQIDDLGTFTPLPLQKTRCLGFKNVKGQILPLMHIKKEKATSFLFPKLLIILEGSERFGVVVEEVVDVLSVPSSLLSGDPPLFKMEQEEVEVLCPSFSDLNQLLSTMETNNDTASQN